MSLRPSKYFSGGAPKSVHADAAQGFRYTSGEPRQSSATTSKRSRRSAAEIAARISSPAASFPSSFSRLERSMIQASSERCRLRSTPATTDFPLPPRGAADFRGHAAPLGGDRLHEAFSWTEAPHGAIVADGKRLEAAAFGPRPNDAPTLILLHEGLGCVALWRDSPKDSPRPPDSACLSLSAGYGRSDSVEFPRPLDYMTREARFSLLSFSAQSALGGVSSATATAPRLRRSMRASTTISGSRGSS